MADQPERRQTSSETSKPPRGWRRWVFPLVTAIAIPLLLLGTLELGLRLAGVGFSPRFWHQAVVPLASDEPAWTPNPRFGWRFFPPAIARSPVISKLAQEPDEDTVRLVVLGGSAALGTPEAAFGFGRLLEVMLQETFPQRKVEVVNAAMTALNSHAVLPIGRESLRRLDPDGLLVYLGNNEVVGPYGPGTVFAGFSDSLSAIRWSLWLSTTRTGQGIRRLAGALGGGEGEQALAQWKGLEMFRRRTVAEDDPRLETVYRHLETNLRDLVAAARGQGVPVLLSTVAVNLTDNPPFASVHRQGLTEEERTSWQEAFDRGVERLDRAENPEQVRQALTAFEEAEAIDDGYAELHFYFAHAHKLLQETEEAERRWRRARDTDALRFRADSRINEVIREVAEEAAGAELVDGEAAVAGDDGPPGNEVFWEHVHLNPEGNFRLATAFFDRLATWPGLRGDDGLEAESESVEAPDVEPPARERVAERLALSAWDRRRMVETILEMTARPPFTEQLGHRQVQRQRQLLAAELAFADRADREQSEALYRRALESRTDDLLLRANYASLLQDRGKWAQAVEQWDELLGRLPGTVSWRTQRAFTLAARARAEAEEAEGPIDSPAMAEALAEMEAILEDNRRSPEAWLNLGAALEQARRFDRAEEIYRRTLERFPSYQAARLNLGTLLAERGKFDTAEQLYRRALERSAETDRATAQLHGRLGEVLERKEDLEAAEAEYRRAVELDPALAGFHNNLGFLLERRGKLNEAVQAYRQAIESDPTFPLPYFNLGDLLLQGGRPAEAAAAYQTGLSLRPSNLQAQYNLGMALAAAGGQAEAAQAFRRLLQVAPEHPGALNNLAWILATASSEELRDAQEAVRLAERAAAKLPGNAQVLETLARAYAVAGRRRDARDTADRALEAARAAGDEQRLERLSERLRDLR